MLPASFSLTYRRKNLLPLRSDREIFSSMRPKIFKTHRISTSDTVRLLKEPWPPCFNLTYDCYLSVQSILNQNLSSVESSFSINCDFLCSSCQTHPEHPGVQSADLSAEIDPLLFSVVLSDTLFNNTKTSEDSSFICSLLYKETHTSSCT